MIKAVIFDYFDVISLSGLENFVARRGVDYHSDKYLQLADLVNTNQISAAEFWRRFAKMCGCSATELEAANSDSAPNRPLLNFIRDRLHGKYKLSILSNISSVDSIKVLSADERAMFDTFSLSCQTGYNKPQAQAYLLAAQNLGVEPEECVFVDDRMQYIRGAENVGMQTVLYKNFEQFRRDLEKILEKENA